MGAYKNYMDSKSLPMAVPLCGMICCPYTLGLTCCCLYCWAKNYTSGLELVTAEKVKSWNTPARCYAVGRVYHCTLGIRSSMVTPH